MYIFFISIAKKEKDVLYIEQEQDMCMYVCMKQDVDVIERGGVCVIDEVCVSVCVMM